MAEATIRSIRPEEKRTRATGYVALVGMTIGVVAAATFVTTHLDAPDVVDLTVRNDTEYHVHIEGIGWARRGGETTFLDVLDEGDGWQVELDYGGIDAGTVAVVDGRIEIPASAEDALRDGGRVPQP